MQKINNLNWLNLLIFLFDRNKAKVFLISTLFLSSMLYFRNGSALYPGLLDEYFYSESTRFLPFSEVRYGNYLFYLIYRITNFCGNGFLSCVYYLNIIFYIGAIVPIYLLARKLCSSRTSAFIGCLAVLGPFNYWTAFYMPESAEFFFFWLFAWSLLGLNDLGSKLRWVIPGMILGLGALIKVHALFMLPAAVLFLAFEVWKTDGFSLHKIFKALSLFIISVALVKLGFGYVFADKAGLSLFGSYGNLTGVANHVVGLSQGINGTKVVTDPRFTPIAILGREGLKAVLINVLPIFVFFGTSIAIILNGLVCEFKKQAGKGFSKNINAFDLYVFSLIFISTLVSGITAYQLIQIASGDGAAELYWRYYEFSFPLFLLCAATSLDNSKYKDSQLQRIFLGLLVVCATYWAISRGYGSQWISLQVHSKIYLGVATISIVTTIIWIFRPILGAKIFLIFLSVLVTIISNLEIYKTYKSTRFIPNDSGIMMYINSRLSKDDLKKLVVVKDTSLTQTVPLMFLNSGNLETFMIPKNQFTFNMDNLPHGKDWVLLLGNHGLQGRALNRNHMDYMSFGSATLFGGHGEMLIDLRLPRWKDHINDITGLYNPPESWGAWSTSNKISIEFIKPLPRKFDLVLSARAYGPNLNQDFMVMVGEDATRFRVKKFPEFEQVIIELANPNKLNRIEILVPQPVSPKKLGLGDDQRELGIGLSEIKIKW